MKYTFEPRDGMITCVAHGDMPTNKIDALRESILKWRRVYKFIRDEQEIPVCDEDSCPLCNLYIHKDCSGCPVRRSTGEKWCDGSPYDSYCRARGHGEGTLAEHLALAEIKFLEMLLDNELAVQTRREANRES